MHLFISIMVELDLLLLHSLQLFLNNLLINRVLIVFTSGYFITSDNGGSHLAHAQLALGFPALDVVIPVDLTSLYSYEFIGLSQCICIPEFCQAILLLHALIQLVLHHLAPLLFWKFTLLLAPPARLLVLDNQHAFSLFLLRIFKIAL